MLTEAQTDLDLFTPDELRAALAVLLTPEAIAGMLDRLAEIPTEERTFFRWSHEVVLAVSAASPEAAARVRAHYGATEEVRERIAAEQAMFAGWRAATRTEPWLVQLAAEELLIDSRTASPRLAGLVFEGQE